MTKPDIVTADSQVDPAFWLRAANGAVRSACHWHIAPIITETLVLDGRGGTVLLLPSQRVHSIERVLADGVDITTQVKFSRNSGMISLASGWPSGLGAIEVTLQHGYAIEEVPEVAGLIVTLTKRASSSGNVVSQAIGSASQRLATGKDGAVLGVPLLESELQTLKPYILTWGA